MKKRIISLLIVCLLICALLPTAAFATETPTITAVNSLEETVGTGYTTIDAAAAAAGVGGKVILSAGTFEFNGRQTIAVNNITLQGAGAGSTIFTTSSSYSQGSVTNRKALLTIAATGVAIEGITFDGGAYGRNLVPDDTDGTEFNVVRINSGTNTISDCVIAGSKRTLLSVGTSSSSATLTATNVNCIACEGKTITNGVSYADVIVVNGTLNYQSGVIDGFVFEDWELFRYSGNFNVNSSTYTGAPFYSLTYLNYIIGDISLISTLQHFVNTYVEVKQSIPTGDHAYLEMLDRLDNRSTVASMVTYAKTIALSDAQTVTNFITVLTDLKDVASSSSYISTIDGYIDELEGALHPTNG